ncbi:MAG TPA: hypothetical protein VGD77_08320 [Gemmatimonadaceae bacterium]
MPPLSTLPAARRVRPRLAGLLALPLLLLSGRPAPASAQILQRMGNAAKSAAATAADAAAEVALSNAAPVALDGWPLQVVPLAAGVGLRVSRVDITDTVGVRLHAFLDNALDAPVKVALPPDSAFTLTDARGRRLAPMARVRVDGHAGVREVTVPPGKGLPVRLLFRAGDAGVVRATFRVGPRGEVGEIPVRLAGIAGGASGASGAGGARAGNARDGGAERAAGQGTGRVAVGDLELAPPAGWQRADQKGVPIFLDPTSTSRVVSFIAVHPPVPLRGTLRDFVRGEFFSKSEQLLGDFGESVGADSRDAGVWTSEKRADGMEVFRRYRAVQVGDRVALLIGTTNDFDRDRAMLDHMYAVAGSVTIAGRGPGAAAVARPVPSPAPRQPSPVTPPPPPSRSPTPAAGHSAREGTPDFVGTYFSWGIINTKLLILANGTWETAQSRGRWSHGGGRMIVLDGNARGWCGGRGILNAEGTQLNFDCVSKDGFPMNISFARHSKEIER